MVDYERILEIGVGVFIALLLVKILLPGFFAAPLQAQEITTADVTNYINNLDSTNREHQSKIKALEAKVSYLEDITPQEIKKLKDRPPLGVVVFLIFAVMFFGLLWVFEMNRCNKKEREYNKERGIVDNIIGIVNDKNKKKIERITRLLANGQWEQ